MRSRVPALIAALALVACIATIGRLLLQPTAPARGPVQASPAPQYLRFPRSGTGTFCSGNRARDWATSPPTTAKMVDLSTGWADGPLRTTDGGSHWVGVEPPSIRDRTPINDEFFLDSRHAWVAETSGSPATCVDQVVTFRTADGGHTWQQAAPLPVRFMDPRDYIWASRASWFSFLDSETGWLLVGSGPGGTTDTGGWPGFGQSWRVGDLYGTTDGGLHWTLVSTDPGAQAGCVAGTAISFSTVTTGWIVADCGLLVSRDGGTTWRHQAVPVTPIDPPAFFDQLNGVLLGVEGLAVTSDGGASWTMRTSPTASFASVVDFINANLGWAVSFLGNDPAQAEFGLYQTSDGARTWTRVNTASLPHLPPANYWRTKGQDAGAWGLDFVDSVHGFWTICGGPPGPCIGDGFFRTADGGRTWLRVTETIEGR
jgi:hypothetical protein